LKHPFLVGISIALLVVLASAVALRLTAQGEPGNGATDAVELGTVWNASLPDLANRPQPIRQWQGKLLVLNFWAPWCPPCREEIPGFIRLQAKYGDRGVQFLGVALDAADRVRAFADQAGIPYPILLGDAGAAELARAAGNRLGGLPYTVVFDRQGRPVATLTGGVDEARLEMLLKPML
jgi:thiol-disulfide isomerase/thioredoxin